MGKKKKSTKPSANCAKAQAKKPKLYVSDETPFKTCARRVGAFIIDWYIAGVLGIAPIMLVSTFQSYQKGINLDPATLGSWALPLTMLSLLIIMAYFFIVPWKVWPGQTLGQRLLSVAIMGDCENYVSVRQLLIRQIGMLVLVETPAIMTGNQVLTLLRLITNSQVADMMTLASFLLLVISGLLFACTNRHLALHDQVAHTRVVTLPRRKSAF